MRILFLTRYGNLGASSRVRSYQYIPYLLSKGHYVISSPLFNNNYLKKLYQGKRICFLNIIYFYLKRIYSLAKFWTYDIIWLEKELFPFMPAIGEKIINILKIPYIVDYDDAMFHRYDDHRNILIRLFLKKKISKVMANSSTVIAGNDYIAQYAIKARPSKIEILPTVVDINKYNTIVNKPNLNFTLGWIGTPMTSHYLNHIAPALRKIQASYNIKILIIGASNIEIDGVQLECLDWSLENEVENIHKITLGIMPLPSDKWELGKCGYKLIQYMACKKPVIASPIGMNNVIVENGVNGFLADSQDDWIKAIEFLYLNPEKMTKIGNTGFNLVKKKYTVQVTASKLMDIISNVSPKKTL